MEERLRNTLSTVNEWVRFAEGKNAALLVADGAAVFGIFQVHAGRDLHWAIDLYSVVAITLLVASAAICLVSFVPELRISWSSSPKQTSPKDNLLFYGHIANYSPREYLESLCRQSNTSVESLGQIQEYYAEQIVVNSRIARAKYRCFNSAVFLTLSAILTPVLVPIIYKLRDQSKE